ncbi:23844_t:CDS:2 [Gigaspora margarita]|uniref:23844_t:CDS:1 n=1 Tax=Gigaspora margarita TaxID=4874 RepID=A0ABN7VND6_GIGMA|nr:23844_t:CDS:2 [Gigaspora margarita]
MEIRLVSNVWNIKKKREEKAAITLSNTKENAIDIENITTTIYKALIMMDNTDENLDSNCGFYFESAINLNTLIEEIPLEIEQGQYEQYLVNRIVKLVEHGDELASKNKKHSDISKQRNTGTYLNQYKCEGLFSISIDIVNKYAKLYQDIISKKLDGFENLTVDQLLLSEKDYKVILDLDEPIHVFSFLTGFFNQLLCETIMVDATYNTNQLKYELYALMTIVDRTGFPLSYCFIEAKKENELKEVKIILSDKDFTQISSGMAIWKNAEIQLCKWHVRRAIEQKLSSQYNGSSPHYNSAIAHQQFFLEATLRKEILEHSDIRFHRHMLIPTADKEFITTSKEIWLRATNEIFQYCYRHNLFHPTTDVLCYVIIDRMLPKLLHRYNLFVNGRILPSWRKDFKAEWKKLANRQEIWKIHFFIKFNEIISTYEAQQTVWELIKNNLPSISTNFAIESLMIDYEEIEDNLGLEECDSNTSDEETTNNKANELKIILEKVIIVCNIHNLFLIYQI